MCSKSPLSHTVISTAIHRLPHTVISINLLFGDSTQTAGGQKKDEIRESARVGVSYHNRFTSHCLHASDLRDKGRIVAPYRSSFRLNLRIA